LSQLLHISFRDSGFGAMRRPGMTGQIKSPPAADVDYRRALKKSRSSVAASRSPTAE
jgi:hypothetical protein